VNLFIRLASLLLVCHLTVDAGADTYKCSQAGKTVISDIPCAAGASKVDQSTDTISRRQKLEAEVINQRNRTQLTELEIKAARDRNIRGSVAIISAEPDTQSVQRGRYR
jgi:uncharacterized membrane protein YcjF (UPF0283 family)